MQEVRRPRALTISGSDSGGGAGIQADLRTFAALNVHGTCAVTAITAQDSLRVYAAEEVARGLVERQIDAVVLDMGVDAVKTGMLFSSAMIRLVARKAREHGFERLVVDPVMVSQGGDRLMEEAAVETLRRELLPAALVVTPNLQEAQVLVGWELRDRVSIERAAREIHGMGPRAVVIKGGHSADPGRAEDCFFDGRQVLWYGAPRVRSPNTHGSGCTFASAVCAYLARGAELLEAVGRAKEFVTEAIRRGYPMGRGPGPVGCP